MEVGSGTEPRGVDRPARNRRLVGASIAMLLVVLAVGGYALGRPAGNADLVFYVATVEQWHGLSGQALSDATYDSVAAYLTPDQDAIVTGATGDPTENGVSYRRAVKADPSALAEQIPFYSVKPLYPALMAALGLAGMPLGPASVAISAVAYALFGLLVFAWAARHLSPWRAWLAATLVVLSPPFEAIARLSSPDALSLLLLTAAMFTFVELRRPGLAVLVFLVAALARPNDALLALAVIGAAAIARPASGVRMRWPIAIGAAIVTVALVVTLSRVSGNYGLGVLFYHAVIAYLPHPALGAPAVALSEIARLYVTRTLELAATAVPLFVLLGSLALFLRVRRPAQVLDDPQALAVGAALLALVPGWLTYPNEPERILVGSFMVFTAVLIAAVGDASGAEPRVPAATAAASGS